jgi:hypothetical protein
MQSRSRDSDTPAAGCNRCGESGSRGVAGCPQCGTLSSGLRFSRLSGDSEGTAAAGAADVSWHEGPASTRNPAESLPRNTANYVSDGPSLVSGWLAPAVTLGAFVTVFGGYVAFTDPRRSEFGPQDDVSSALPGIVVGMSWVPNEAAALQPDPHTSAPPSIAPSARFDRGAAAAQEARRQPSPPAGSARKPSLTNAANWPRAGSVNIRSTANCGRYSQAACPVGSAVKATKVGIRAAVLQPSPAARSGPQAKFAIANTGAFASGKAAPSRLYRQH